MLYLVVPSAPQLGNGIQDAIPDVVPRRTNMSHHEIPSEDGIRDVIPESAYARSIYDARRLHDYRSCHSLTSCAEHILVWSHMLLGMT